MKLLQCYTLLLILCHFFAFKSDDFSYESLVAKLAFSIEYFTYKTNCKVDNGGRELATSAQLQKI